MKRNRKPAGGSILALVKFVQGEEIKKHSSDEIDVEGVCWALVLRWIAECAKEEESTD